MHPDEYCAQRTAQSGSSFYYSFLFLAEPQRRQLTALYAFCREIDDAVDEVHDPGVAQAKLNWWREEIQRLYADMPQHPVTRALAPCLTEVNLPEEYFQEIIDGMAMDLDQTRYANSHELALYCHRVAGVVGLLSAEIFGYQDRRTLKYAEELGLACQLTNIIRDVREDAQRGRIYLPLDSMKIHDVHERDLVAPTTSPKVLALLTTMAQSARGHYRHALATLPDCDRYAQRGGIIMAALYQALLDRLEKRGFKLADKPRRPPAWRMLWIAWSIARREKLRHLNAGGD